KKGQRLERIPSLTTVWSYWLMLHPESTAYNLFDGKKYSLVDLPREMTVQATEWVNKVYSSLEPLANVLGVEVGSAMKADPFDRGRSVFPGIRFGFRNSRRAIFSENACLPRAASRHPCPDVRAME